MRLPLLFCVALASVQLAPIALPQPPADKPGKHFKRERCAARWANLTDDERAKIRTAHEKAMADPAVKAAHERLKQARKEFREVMRPAMLRADPSIQPLLDKLFAERAALE